MNKAIRTVIGVVAVVACLWWVYHVFQKRQFAQELQRVKEMHQDANSPEEFEKVRKEYESLLPKAPGGAERRIIQGGIAACEAWIAYYDTTSKPSIKKYENLIALMRKAKELTGDPDGVWAKNLVEFEKRYKESLGPSPEEMRATWTRLSSMPFEKAASDLETLYRWRQIWNDQGLYVNDPVREPIFAQVREALLNGYSREFEKAIQAAKKPKASLEELAAPLGPLAQVRRFDEGKAAEYSKKFAPELAEAEKAAKKLAELAEKMMGGPPPPR